MFGEIKMKQDTRGAASRRKFERSPILTRAEVKAGDRTELALVWNLNGEGALLSHVDDLPVDTEFTISLMGAKDLQAIVIRETDDYTAIAFDVNALVKL